MIHAEKRCSIIACPHFSISIRQRSKRQSAVAGAAYQSGEKLFSEYDCKTKNYNYKAQEVVAKGILLPPNAPPEYADRQTLWNAAEKAEGQWNSQLARGIIMALPRELPKTECEFLIRDYCREQFVSRGMIADFAIHDKGDGNPHAHILLTMRAMDENGKWLPKAHKVYDLDENGERIRLSSGEWKSHKEDTVDWNDRKNAEVWRTEWANVVNRYFEKNDIPERLDLRSFERQGKEALPTVHLGPAVAHMEAKGVLTEIGDYNRKVKAHNDKLASLRKLLADLCKWLKTVTEKIAVLTQQEASSPTIMDFINAYFDMRKNQRLDWNKYAKQKGSVVDLKQRSKIFNWLQETGITTMEDFKAMMESRQPIIDEIKTNEKRIKRIDMSIGYIDTSVRLQPIADKSKRGFKGKREKYAETHTDELAEYHKAIRYLKANSITTEDREKLATEAQILKKENKTLNAQLQSANMDSEIIRQIRYCVDAVLHEAEIPKKKESTLDMLKADRPPAPQKRIHKKDELSM